MTPNRVSTAALLWLTGSLFLGAPSAARAQIQRSSHFTVEYQQGMMEAVVRLSVRKADGWYYGTGVSIGYAKKYNYLLTCAHVVEGAKEIHFDVFSRKTYPNPYRTYKKARWSAWWNTKEDIAVIRAAIYVPKKIRVCRKGTQVQQEGAVLSVGCGLGAPPVCQVGFLAGLDDAGAHVFNRGNIGGRSGSALVTRRDGLIGIVTGGWEDKSRAVHHDQIHGLLERNKLGWLIPKA
jgi:hypothetical protein